MKSFLFKSWRILRWPLGVLLFLYVALVLYRIPAVGEMERTEEAVARIHAARITLDTVMGEHLPLPPNEEENNGTLAGVDNNANGIRDDVELAIFARHPDSARARAPMLQYALELQMEFTEVFNSKTLVAVIQEEGRGDVCILDWEEIELVDSLVFNTSVRKEFQEEIYEKYMTSYALPNSGYCDIDPESLPN